MANFALFLLVLLAASASNAQVTVTTFEGVYASSYSYAGLNVDPNGAVGTRQYMEWVNPVYQVSTKLRAIQFSRLRSMEALRGGITVCRTAWM